MREVTDSESMREYDAEYGARGLLRRVQKVAACAEDLQDYADQLAETDPGDSDKFRRRVGFVNDRFDRLTKAMRSLNKHYDRLTGETKKAGAR